MHALPEPNDRAAMPEVIADNVAGQLHAAQDSHLQSAIVDGRIYRFLGRIPPLAWLLFCKNLFVWCAVNILAAVLWIMDWLTNRKIALIKAEAAAEKTRAEADKLKAEAEAIREKSKAEAEKIKAEASVTKAKGIAEAHCIEAEAQSKQADADRRKYELQVLKKAKRAVPESVEDARHRVNVLKPKKPATDVPSAKAREF
jgi:F0F1-type ATP synthase membrane subunit b/b'